MRLIYPPALAAVLWLFAVPGGRAAEPATAVEKKEEKKARRVFPPEAETKFAELLKRLSEAKQKFWVLGIKAETEVMAKAAGLDAEAVKALNLAGEQAASLCIAGWLDKIDEAFRRETNQEVETMSQMLDQALAMVDTYANQEIVSDYVRPLDHADWAGAVERILTADQKVAWEKEKGSRQDAFTKEVADFLKPQAEATREQKKMEVAARVADLKLVVPLSKEAEKKIDALAKTMADDAAEGWRKRAEKMLLAMGADQRRQTVKTGRFYFGESNEGLPNSQVVWKEAIAKIISPEELKLWESAQEEHASRRGRILGSVTLALLDDKVAFNTAQREKLEPIAQRAVLKQPSLFPEGALENYYNFSMPVFFAAAASASAEEIKAILDEAQWKHWQEAVVNANAGGRRPVPVEKPAQPPSRPFEPEDSENALSEFLHAKTQNERKQLLAGLMLQAEELARVTGLGQEAVARLQTAARGAVEEILEGWRVNVDQNIRSQVGDAKNIAQRLAGIADYNFQFGQRGASAQKAVWVKALKSELSEEQRVAWKKEVDERTRYKEKAVTGVILAEFDRKNRLSLKQWESLEPLIAAMIKDYSQDISGMFSSSDSTPWYLQSYMMFIPLAGIPEADLKAILGKEQWERWTQSNDFSNSANYFQNIQQNHKNRVKEAK